jgi:O-acetyl-ADP-ribose deacetylase (regulator of RNase III)
VPGGEICGRFQNVAGPELEKLCKKIGGCQTGKEMMTPGFNILAKYVIHAVEPIGEKPLDLHSAYESIFSFIDGKDVRSVALCSLSTGIFGYPFDKATLLQLETVRKFLENAGNREKVERIVFVVYEELDLQKSAHLIPQYFPIEMNHPDFQEKLKSKLKNNSIDNFKK